jgi:hypothetical protein
MHSGTKEEKNAKWRECYYKVGYSKYVVRKNRIRVQKLKEWFIKYKEQLKCKNCGETHIACLDFHHKNPKEKEINLSSAIYRKWSIKRITAELEKCEVLCCKCHRIYHYNENPLFSPCEIPELTEEEKPKYLGHHGNHLPKKTFDELNEYHICDQCGKRFPILKQIVRRKKVRGITRFFCTKECWHQAMRDGKLRIPTIQNQQIMESLDKTEISVVI